MGGGVEKVDDIMDIIQEQQDLAADISGAISRPMAGMTGIDGFDDDDLLAELEELEQGDIDSALIDVNPTPQINLPAVPQNPMPAVQQNTKEDEDLADLNSW